MAVNVPTAVVGAGATAFGAQSLTPLLGWLAEHYQIQPQPTAEVLYSTAVILIGVFGGSVGSACWLIRALMLRWLKKHHIELPESGATV